METNIIEATGKNLDNIINTILSYEADSKSNSDIVEHKNLKRESIYKDEDGDVSVEIFKLTDLSNTYERVVVIWSQSREESMFVLDNEGEIEHVNSRITYDFFQTTKFLKGSDFRRICE